jgi:hypothetical protein
LSILLDRLYRAPFLSLSAAGLFLRTGRLLRYVIVTALFVVLEMFRGYFPAKTTIDTVGGDVVFSGNIILISGRRGALTLGGLAATS